MSGVIGAVSNKFILVAATLMLPVTINRDRVHGAVDPALKTSVISPQLAARYHLDDKATSSNTHEASRHRPLNIGLGAENFDVDTVGIGRDPCCADRDFVIGQDILGGHVFDIDFVHRTIRLVLPFEYRRATRHFRSIALSRGADGSRLIPIQIGESPPINAMLDLADPGALKVDRATFAANHSLSPGERRAIQSGGATIGNLPISIADEQRRPVPAVLGIAAFAGSRIVLDLPHDLIWIALKS